MITPDGRPGAASGGMLATRDRAKCVVQLQLAVLEVHLASPSGHRFSGPASCVSLSAGRLPEWSDLTSLSYFNMVMKESMRLHPVAGTTATFRVTDKDTQVMRHATLAEIVLDASSCVDACSCNGTATDDGQLARQSACNATCLAACGTALQCLVLLSVTFSRPVHFCIGSVDADSCVLPLSLMAPIP